MTSILVTKQQRYLALRRALPAMNLKNETVPSLQLNSILQHSRVYDEYTRRPLLLLRVILGTRFAKRAQQRTD